MKVTYQFCIFLNYFRFLIEFRLMAVAVASLNLNSKAKISHQCQLRNALNNNIISIESVMQKKFNTSLLALFHIYFWFIAKCMWFTKPANTISFHACSLSLHVQNPQKFISIMKSHFINFYFQFVFNLCESTYANE